MTGKKKGKENLKPIITRQEFERRIQEGIEIIYDIFSKIFSKTGFSQLSKSEREEFDVGSRKIIERFLKRIFRIVENDAK